MSYPPDSDRKSWYSAESSPAGENSSPDPGRPPYLPEGYQSPYLPSAPRKRRSAAGKIIAVTVCVLILVAAAAFVFAGDTENASAETGIADPRNRFDDYDDAMDFFENYYTYTASFADIDIPKYRDCDGVSLSISAVPSHGEMTLQEIYAACAPTVVGITTAIDGEDHSWGTGIIFTQDGFIITNAHVLEGVDSAVITLWDDTEYNAKLVGYDSLSDLAILKIRASGLQYAEFGDSSALRVGDRVAAIGNPLGREFRGTMTDGIISAINRDVTSGGHTMTLLQTNAAINEGNSGGPLFNMYGQVVGVTNMKMMSYYTSIEGIGFAIPSSTVGTTVKQLLELGYVPGHPSIGITAGGIPEDAAAQYGLPDGVFVTVVDEASDAYKKGIRPGDVITAVNDEPVSSVDEINQIKEGFAVGDTLLMTVFRDGETFVVDVVLIDSSLLG